jgi:hypothetical protein
VRGAGRTPLRTAAIASVLHRTESPALAIDRFLRATIFNLAIGAADYPDAVRPDDLVAPFAQPRAIADEWARRFDAELTQTSARLLDHLHVVAMLYR